MIIVCEPQCKGISHEEVNSGFIYGLHLAYPKEKINFFAEKDHFRKINDLLKDNKIHLPSFVNSSINFNAESSFTFGGLIKYHLLVKHVFDISLSHNQTKIFFLSNNPIILFNIKLLKSQRKYKGICCTIVLHGELEDIANNNYKNPYEPVTKTALTINRFIKHPGIILLFACQTLSWPYRMIYSKYTLLFKKIFRTKTIMMWKHSNKYHYISMSPHVTQNAKKYIDIDYLNFYTIFLPIIFTKPQPSRKNNFIKFAVFGYGDSSQMQKMLGILSKRKITKPYEIRIISMDSRGTEGFPNVTILSQGKVLTRKEMEDATQGVDVFINLYDKTRHKFGCSLSIFEAFSYLKPVLHLSNPGYDYFNKDEKPIGYRTENIQDFVDKMVDMVENYSKYKKQLEVFRKNMLEYRKEYNIADNLDNLKDSFTFN